jgi:hypothetical protein
MGILQQCHHDRQDTRVKEYDEKALAFSLPWGNIKSVDTDTTNPQGNTMHLSQHKAATITAALASIGTDDQIKALGIDAYVASHRTLALNLPDGKYDLDGTPINRVKIVAHDDGTVDLRLIGMPQQVSTLIGGNVDPVTHETVHTIQPADVGTTLAAKIELAVQ